MTIDKKKLVELLVEKTSMNKEEVKAQLDQLIERILDAAKRGKALEIKEFGVFYFNEEGELRFDASDELSTEISFKYAGMKPVELKPERDTSIPEDIEEMEDDIEETGVEEVDEDGDEELFPDPFEETDEPEESGSIFDTEEPEEEDSPFDFDDEEKDEELDNDIISDPFSEEALEPLEEQVESEDEKTTNIEDIKPSASRKPVKKKDNTGVFILIAIVVIAVLIGAYFFYISTQPQSSPESTQTMAQMESNMSESDDAGTSQTDVSTTEPSGEPSMENQETNTAEQAGANQGTEEENMSNNIVSATQTDQNLYGLMGNVIEEANNGYSIVVHSFRNEQNAREAATQLQTDGGYRVIVNSRTVYENQVWRVSVGQFETLGDAQQATTRLPDPYNTQNFIQRIRLN